MTSSRIPPDGPTSSSEWSHTVDKLSLSYHVLWNGLKKIVADFSEDEKDAMFHGTAARVYRL